jgi:hypothetical protein
MGRPAPGPAVRANAIRIKRRWPARHAGPGHANRGAGCQPRQALEWAVRSVALFGECPIRRRNGEVIPAAAEVIADPGDVRPCRVEAACVHRVTPPALGTLAAAFDPAGVNGQLAALANERIDQLVDLAEVVGDPVQTAERGLKPSGERVEDLSRSLA